MEQVRINVWEAIFGGRKLFLVTGWTQKEDSEPLQNNNSLCLDKNIYIGDGVWLALIIGNMHKNKQITRA